MRQKAYLLFYTLRNAPGTMTSRKRNTGNVDKDRMDELTREFEAKKRKLDEEEIEKEKNEKKITDEKEKDSNTRSSSSEEEKQEEQEDAVTVISARKNGKRSAGRSAGKNSREVVKSKLFKQNRNGSKSPDFSITNKENAVNEQRVVTTRTQSKKKKTKVTKKTGKRK